MLLQDSGDDDVCYDWHDDHGASNAVVVGDGTDLVIVV